MIVKKITPPLTFNLDSKFGDVIIGLRKAIKDGDLKNPLSRLTNKELYILAITFALENKLKPKDSKKSQTFFRTEDFERDPSSLAILKGLIYNKANKDINIILPENYSKFYKPAEKFANAGMPKVMEFLKKDQKDIEEMALLYEKKIIEHKK